MLRKNIFPSSSYITAPIWCGDDVGFGEGRGGSGGGEGGERHSLARLRMVGGGAHGCHHTKNHFKFGITMLSGASWHVIETQCTDRNTPSSGALSHVKETQRTDIKAAKHTLFWSSVA